MRTALAALVALALASCTEQEQPVPVPRPGPHPDLSLDFDAFARKHFPKEHGHHAYFDEQIRKFEKALREQEADNVKGRADGSWEPCDDDAERHCCTAIAIQTAKRDEYAAKLEELVRKKRAELARIPDDDQ